MTARIGWLIAGWLLLGLLRSTSTSAQSATVPPPPADLPSLRAQLSAHVSQGRFRHARWGIQIISLDTGAAVFAENADQLFIPASNTKLFTGALALDRLGPDFRIRTSVQREKPVDRHGALAGDLILYGRGDPTFATRYHEGRLERVLAPLVDVATAAGLRRVRGDLVVDPTYFAGPPLGSGWEWDDLRYEYGAEVSALTLNDNVLEVRVQPATVPGRPATIRLEPATSFVVIRNACVTGPPGAARNVQVLRPLNQNVVFVSGQIPVGDAGYSESVSVHEPAAWFGQLFKEQLAQRGVRVSGQVRAMDAWGDGTTPARPSSKRVELGFVDSPPLRELLALMLKPSQNLYAQLLLLQVGAAELARTATNGSSLRGTPSAGAALTAESAGIQALGAFLKSVGIPPDEALFEEGSGLTRRNLVTPAATVRLLQHMDRHAAADVFRAALPVAGVDGTLKNRMKATPAAGNARAKTGSLNYVSALSGYVVSAAGERFAFSILVNNFKNPEPNRPIRADLDEIVVTLARLPWRTAAAGPSGQ